jgi:hypothetical protein
VPVIAMVSALANMCEFTTAPTTTTETAIGCVMGCFVPGVAYVSTECSRLGRHRRLVIDRQAHYHKAAYRPWTISE